MLAIINSRQNNSSLLMKVVEEAEEAEDQFEVPLSQRAPLRCALCKFRLAILSPELSSLRAALLH